MSAPWNILGLPKRPETVDDIHAAYKDQKEAVLSSGDLMVQLSLEDAYLSALELWDHEDDYCERAVATDRILETVMAEHPVGEPLSSSELQDIATRIMRTLHNPWHRNSIAVWNQIFDLDPIIDQTDRQFEDVLREAMLRFLGYYDSHKGQRNKSLGPRILQIKSAQYIFARAGWADVKPASEKERREIDWLCEELDIDATELGRTKAGLKDVVLVLGVFFAVLLLFFTFIFWFKR